MSRKKTATKIIDDDNERTSKQTATTDCLDDRAPESTDQFTDWLSECVEQLEPSLKNKLAPKLLSPEMQNQLRLIRENYEFNRQQFELIPGVRRDHGKGSKELLRAARVVLDYLPDYEKNYRVADLVIGDFNPMRLELQMLAVCQRNRDLDFFAQNEEELKAIPEIKLSQNYNLDNISESIQVLIAAMERLEKLRPPN